MFQLTAREHETKQGGSEMEEGKRERNPNPRNREQVRDTHNDEDHQENVAAGQPNCRRDQTAREKGEMLYRALRFLKGKLQARLQKLRSGRNQRGQVLA